MQLLLAGGQDASDMPAGGGCVGPELKKPDLTQDRPGMAQGLIGG